MITTDFAKKFSREWIESWNSHNLDIILSHYSDDFTINSPMAIKLLRDGNGLVIGKDNVRKYWTIGLEKMPNLKFELIDTLIGINGITLYYINTVTNKKTAEVMIFNEDLKIYKVEAYYSE